MHFTLCTCLYREANATTVFPFSVCLLLRALRLHAINVCASWLLPLVCVVVWDSFPIGSALLIVDLMGDII